MGGRGVDTRVLRVRLIVVFCLILAGAVIGFFLYGVLSQFSADTAFAKENLIRLHVLANSNSPGDQDLKLLVRDAVLAETKDIFAEAQTKEEAQVLIVHNRHRIEKAAQKVIEEAGYDYPVTLMVGHFQFPERVYGTLVLPQGGYDALKVEIGAGAGDNWWCVLFPPLCFAGLDGNTSAEPLAKVNTDKEASGIAFRIKLWDQLLDSQYAKQIQKWWQASAVAAHPRTSN